MIFKKLLPFLLFPLLAQADLDTYREQLKETLKDSQERPVGGDDRLYAFMAYVAIMRSLDPKDYQYADLQKAAQDAFRFRTYNIQRADLEGCLEQNLKKLPRDLLACIRKVNPPKKAAVANDVVPASDSNEKEKCIAAAVSGPKGSCVHLLHAEFFCKNMGLAAVPAMKKCMTDMHAAGQSYSFRSSLCMGGTLQQSGVDTKSEPVCRNPEQQKAEDKFELAPTTSGT